LLVSEGHGGGTISGQGLADLSLVAYGFGRHAAPGPLLGTNVVASTLSRHGVFPEVLAGLLSGRGVAAWCAPLTKGTGWKASVSAHRRGSDLVLSGAVGPVESAEEAGHFLVSCGLGDGSVQVIVPRGTPGLATRPLHTVDLTRRFSRVSFDDVVVSPESVLGPPPIAAADIDRQFQQAWVVLNAECVGTMQTGFDMTVEWAFDRYTFGRPLASYQALKHRFADMKCWLEASHAISDAACMAVETSSDDVSELLSAAKAYVGQYGGELLQDCVQMHGGIGLTFEHDLHLFLRRFTVDRALAGTPADHRQHIAEILLSRKEAAAA
jgi:alkylation response protein AidB-like acyl-CoA dehydrogenase